MSLHDAGLVWLRRDLRAFDHAALARALRDCRRVWCVFVFDRDILDALLARGLVADRRVEFIHASLLELDAELRRLGGGLIVLHERAPNAIPMLAARLGVDAVYANRDYEPAAVARDAAVAAALARDGRAFHSFKDQVIFEQDEVMTAGGTPFSVFTPYKNAWLRRLLDGDTAAHEVAAHAGALARVPADLERAPPALAELGFARTNLGELGVLPGARGASALFADFLERMDAYQERRDFPALRGPSYLSVHLRFGTISIRALVRAALQRQASTAGTGAQVWLSELIWRDFYFQILHHHPRVVAHAFKPAYDAIVWEHGAHADALFAAWCAGRTGYPLVDAAMAQIHHSGYMHNRLRMVVASFLVKDLGIDWRRGEQYFADHLIDFDLAANNGGWQWAASTGCDAQPWFRIFNPVTQSEKFDAGGKFIQRYLPELARVPARQIHAPWLLTPLERRGWGADAYPAPVVAHDQARARTLLRYAVVKNPAATGPQTPL